MDKAIIGGNIILETKFWAMGRPKRQKTPYGDFYYRAFQKSIIICRHGGDGKIPPHMVNHHANIWGIKKMRIKNIFGFHSVGSLNPKILPGNILLPDDFIDFSPPTFFKDDSRFTVPCVSEKLRKILSIILKRLKIPFLSSGVYFNSQGPRLETRAEIKMIKKFAHVVGMTMAKEATLARELEIEYASICSVDNFAHGIRGELEVSEIFKNQIANLKRLEKIIEELIHANID